MKRRDIISTIGAASICLSGCLDTDNTASGEVVHKRLMGKNRDSDGTTTILSESRSGEIHLEWAEGEIRKEQVREGELFVNLPMDKLYSEFGTIYSELNIRLTQRDRVNRIPRGEIQTYRSYLELYKYAKFEVEYQLHLAEPRGSGSFGSRPRILDLQ